MKWLLTPAVLALSSLSVLVFACTDDGGDASLSAQTGDHTSTEDSSDATAEATQTGDGDTGTGDGDDTMDMGYPQGPYGVEVGDVIADLEFVRGDEQLLALSSFHATPPPALVIFSTTAW